MSKVRYVGSAPWSRTLIRENKDGVRVLDRTIVVMPGDVVELDDDVAEKFTSSEIPRHHRNFVEVNGPEDRMGSSYEATRSEMRGQNNASLRPEVDFGSTVPEGRVQFLTQEEAEEVGLTAAEWNEGTPSNNERAIMFEEAEQVAREAYVKALKERMSKSNEENTPTPVTPTPAATTSTTPTTTEKTPTGKSQQAGKR
jgi:hypothetical protein